MSWWPFRSESKKQDFVEEYLRLFEKPIPGIRKITQLDFVVLDTETTGLDPKNDYVISFGGIKIQKGKILVETAIEWYPESPKEGADTAMIHGLVNRENLLRPKVFSEKLLEYIGPSILVGHHLNFDLEMLQKIGSSSGLKNFRNPSLDTLELAVRLEHGPHVNWQEIPMKEYSLDALCERYQIPSDDRHTAGGDAFLTAQLLLKLLKVAEKKGIVNYQQLFR
ncbi:3'-5' exonuclease [Algoriphagus kandeliae]|uniref:3'-5' exonuclease n=1 Tax=Algoriphagus kandeliae TaxID=2562278 RepID=A0A4Y9QU91_9BACT|nr:3'-5' exonuclease [Algoriphagus kandeliae]TFV95630.1 3'-5' exonuclease [Algoriphagus kandeliae]